MCSGFGLPSEVEETLKAVEVSQKVALKASMNHSNPLQSQPINSKMYGKPPRHPEVIKNTYEIERYRASEIDKTWLHDMRNQRKVLHDIRLHPPGYG